MQTHRAVVCSAPFSQHIKFTIISEVIPIINLSQKNNTRRKSKKYKNSKTWYLFSFTLVGHFETAEEHQKRRTIVKSTDREQKLFLNKNAIIENSKFNKILCNTSYYNSWQIGDAKKDKKWNDDYFLAAIAAASSIFLKCSRLDFLWASSWTYLP